MANFLLIVGGVLVLAIAVADFCSESYRKPRLEKHRHRIRRGLGNLRGRAWLVVAISLSSADLLISRIELTIERIARGYPRRLQIAAVFMLPLFWAALIWHVAVLTDGKRPAWPQVCATAVVVAVAAVPYVVLFVPWSEAVDWADIGTVIVGHARFQNWLRRHLSRPTGRVATPVARVVLGASVALVPVLGTLGRGLSVLLAAAYGYSYGLWLYLTFVPARMVISAASNRWGRLKTRREAFYRLVQRPAEQPPRPDDEGVEALYSSVVGEAANITILGAMWVGSYFEPSWSYVNPVALFLVLLSGAFACSSALYATARGARRFEEAGATLGAVPRVCTGLMLDLRMPFFMTVMSFGFLLSQNMPSRGTSDALDVMLRTTFGIDRHGRTYFGPAWWGSKAVFVPVVGVLALGSVVTGLDWLAKPLQRALRVQDRNPYKIIKAYVAAAGAVIALIGAFLKVWGSK